MVCMQSPLLHILDPDTLILFCPVLFAGRRVPGSIQGAPWGHV